MSPYQCLYYLRQFSLHSLIKCTKINKKEIEFILDKQLCLSLSVHTKSFISKSTKFSKF